MVVIWQVFGAPTFFIGDEMFWGKDPDGFHRRRIDISLPEAHSAHANDRRCFIMVIRTLQNGRVLVAQTGRSGLRSINHRARRTPEPGAASYNIAEYRGFGAP
jgi:hypothetical protein